jgi:hypothetical protein
MKSSDLNVLISVAATLAAFLAGMSVAKLTDGRGDSFTALSATLSAVATIVCLRFIIRALRKPPNA